MYWRRDCWLDNFDAKKTYAIYRLEKSKEDLNAAKLMFEQGYLKVANNRAYYSIFHAIRAVLAFDGFDSKNHGQIIGKFRKDYVKTGLFDREMSDIVGSAFEIRTASDYDDMFIAIKSDTILQIEDAEKFYNTILEYINNLKL